MHFLKLHERSWTFTTFFWILLNSFEFFWIRLNTFEYFWIHLNTFEDKKCSKYILGYSNAFKCIQMYSNVFKCIQMYSNVFKSIQTNSKVFRFCQICLNFSKLLQINWIKLISTIKTKSEGKWHVLLLYYNTVVPGIEDHGPICEKPKNSTKNRKSTK